MPENETEYFPLQGGLDLLTPSIRIAPGKCVDAMNYEPEISGGYRRIDGYERFDGRTSPTSAQYWVLPMNITGTIAVNNTLTGATSGATLKVLSIVGSNIIGGRLSGTFVSGENITISAVVVGSTTGAAVLGGAATADLDADYTLLAANDRRNDIGKVPGSGQIRGVWVYKDVVYAFRDNALGTGGDMYKSTTSGWVQISFGKEIQFSGATGQISDGASITGASSGATATVVRAMLRSGTWTASGTGTLILSGVTGTFTNGENIQVGGVTKVVAASGSTSITRAAGGRVECCNFNFTGSTATEKMYGADGVNLAFEFDGTNYIPIRTGMAADTPTHVIGYKNYLFLSFLGSVQFSGLGAPYSWTAVLGAGEIATGDTVTGFLPQGGDSSGSSMAIYTKSKTYILYGTSASDFKLVSSNWDIGFSAYTMQMIGNGAFGVTARGVQQMITTLQYGDFDYSSVSHLLQPFMANRLGLECASTTLRTKNQYRMFFTDGTGLAVGLTGDKVSGILPLNLPAVVRCIVTTTLSTGAEVTYFGSDDGYIYQADTGTSFDGSSIEAWLRLAFNHTKSPRLRKRYRRAVLELTVANYSQVNVSYDLGYGSSQVQPSVAVLSYLTGGGGYWDQFTWDQFNWDAQFILDPTIPLDGTEKNISLLFYSNRAQDKSHTLQGVTLVYTPRRLER
jgi:hypothetical protein